MPKSRNRKIKHKNNVRVCSTRKTNIEQKIPGEGWVNALVFATMLAMATGLMYSIKSADDSKKVVPLSENQAARQQLDSVKNVKTAELFNHRHR